MINNNPKWHNKHNKKDISEPSLVTLIIARATNQNGVFKSWFINFTEQSKSLIFRMLFRLIQNSTKSEYLTRMEMPTMHDNGHIANIFLNKLFLDKHDKSMTIWEFIKHIKSPKWRSCWSWNVTPCLDRMTHFIMIYK